jgi:hypothetical protein
MNLLTVAELKAFDQVPEADLVGLSIDLDVPVPDQIDRERLLNVIVHHLAELGKRDGLPFSEYDREDLARLDHTELKSIAFLSKVKRPSSDHQALVGQIIKAGKKVYKRYTKYNPGNQIPMFLPMLLIPLARLASETSDEGASDPLAR